MANESSKNAAIYGETSYEVCSPLFENLFHKNRLTAVDVGGKISPINQNKRVVKPRHQSGCRAGIFGLSRLIAISAQRRRDV